MKACDALHPALLATRCRHCGHCEVPQVAPGRGPHAAAALCPRCGGFVRWLKKRVVAELQAHSEFPLTLTQSLPMLPGEE
jgi:hypothetical protein